MSKSKPTTAVEPTLPPREHLYRDEQGRLIGKVCVRKRADGTKKVWQESLWYEASGWHHWEPGGFGKVLYNLEEVLEVVNLGGHVHITEGEKDAETLIALGLTATTNPCGAKAWPDSLSKQLVGGGKFIVHLDRDKDGWERGELIKASLAKVMSDVPVDFKQSKLENPKADVTDHLEAGFSLDELLPVDLVRDDPPTESGDYEVLNHHERVARAEAIKRDVVEAIDRHGSDNGEDSAELEAERLSDIEEEIWQWLWDDVIPLGVLVCEDGDPDSGKTFVFCDLVARITTGRPMPDGSRANGPPRTVIIVTPEDSLAKTIRPRLRAADADLDMVRHIKVRRDKNGHIIPLFLDEVLPELERLLVRYEVAMIIFDPIGALLSEKVNSHNDASMRRHLTPLVGILEEHSVTGLMIRHLNQDGSLKALQRGSGSNAPVQVSRAAFSVAYHPDSSPEDDNRLRCFVQSKGNLTKKKLAIGFHVESHPELDIGRVVWHKEALDLDADTLLKGRDGRKDSPKLREAVEVLHNLLANGPRHVSGDGGLEAETKKAGVTWGTANRAASAMKVVKIRHWKPGGGVDYVTWELPVTGQSDVIPFNLPVSAGEPGDS